MLSAKLVTPDFLQPGYFPLWSALSLPLTSVGSGSNFYFAAIGDEKASLKVCDRGKCKQCRKKYCCLQQPPNFVFVAIVTFVATDFLPRFVLLVVVTGN